MNGLQASGRSRAGNCTGASIQARRGGSKPRGLAGRVVTERPLGLLIELTGPDVLLKLPVPGLGIKGGKPLPEVGELVVAQLLDITFDRLDFAHTLNPE